MKQLTIYLLVLVSGAGLVAVPAQAAVPPVEAVALTSRELPAHLMILTRASHYWGPTQMNGDTVPFGLTVKELRSLGFRGLYAQTLGKKNDYNNPYGYSWQYMSFGTPAAAHTVFLRWGKVFKYPFTQKASGPGVCAENRYYKVIGVSPAQIGLLCRTGSFVMLGHYLDTSTVVSLMRHVSDRAKHTRP
jgi:hypothetical protein